MKIIPLFTFLVINSQYAYSQEFTIIKNHPNQWQIPDACLTDITRRIDNHLAEVECKKLIFSTGDTTHNINFVVSDDSTVSFVAEIGANNKTLNVSSIVLWGDGKPTILSTQGECVLVNKGDRLDNNRAANYDIIGCVAQTDDHIISGVARFNKLQSSTAIKMFR